jgi:hypothetical protein
MTTNYKTNKHIKNKTIEERLERVANHLETLAEFIDPDNEPFYGETNMALRHETWVVASQSCGSVSLPQPAGDGTVLLAEVLLSRPGATA